MLWRGALDAIAFGAYDYLVKPLGRCDCQYRQSRARATAIRRGKSFGLSRLHQGYVSDILLVEESRVCSI